MNYLFYESTGISCKPIIHQMPYSIYLWKPKLDQIIPPGLSEKKFAVWWLMHQLRIFPNRDYGVLLFFNGNYLIHRSCIFPRYFRFPFMDKNDLQIGDTFTDEKYRGQGIAAFAIQKILELCKMDNRKFWYIVEENNESSIRVIEKVGFNKIGFGVRTKKLGLKLLGSFDILRHV